MQRSSEYLPRRPGSSNNGEFKNYGSSGASDRALGSIARDGTGTLYYGVRYANNTGSTISSIEVRYTGEQWRRDNASPHVLSFSYRQAATVTSLTTGTFTPVPALNFTTPQTGGSLQLNGNLAANRTVLSSSFPVTVPNGEEIMLRWTDVNDSGNNHGFGIDDLSVTARAASTASRVTISGRAVTSNGWGIGRAIVTLSGGNLSVPLYSVSNQFGYYRFSDIPVGQSYVVFITSKTYRFSQASRFVNLSQEATDINFTGER